MTDLYSHARQATGFVYHEKGYVAKISLVAFFQNEGKARALS